MPNEHPFTGPHEFELSEWISLAPFETSLGIQLNEAADGAAILTMPFTANLTQGAGLMHGGALFSLADTTLAMATKSVIEPYSHFGTIAMDAKVLRPVTRGWVTATGRIVKRVDRELHGECEVTNEDGTVVFEFRSVNKLARNTRIPNVTFRDRSR